MNPRKFANSSNPLKTKDLQRARRAAPTLSAENNRGYIISQMIKAQTAAPARSIESQIQRTNTPSVIFSSFMVGVGEGRSLPRFDHRSKLAESSETVSRSSFLNCALKSARICLRRLKVERASTSASDGSKASAMMLSILLGVITSPPWMLEARSAMMACSAAFCSP